MFCRPCIVVYQYSKTNEMHFLYSIYCELTASTCFQHYLLIFRRRYTNNNWYIACVLCLLAATRIGVELNNNWYIACVLCLLAATRIGVELNNWYIACVLCLLAATRFCLEWN
jgi:uncharacterized membrane protein